LRQILILLGISLFLIGCSSTPSEDNPKETIYTTIYPLYFLLNELIGEEIDIYSVYPPGVDAHSYEPTTREVLDIASAKALFYLGAGMEGFAEKAQSALKNSDVKFFEIGKHEEIFLKAEDDHHHSDYDPHLWFDPLRMIQMAEILSEELSLLFPEHDDALSKNLESLSKDLQALDQLYEKEIAKAKNKYILVSHGAYEYWEERYGLIQIPISGLSSTDEPSQKDLAHLIELAREHKIEYVFFESHATNKTAEIIVNTLKAKKAYIHNLELLVDEDIKEKEDYFSLMEKNLTELMKAIQ